MPHGSGSVSREGEVSVMVDGHRRHFGSTVAEISSQSDRLGTVLSSAGKVSGIGGLGEWGMVIAESSPEGKVAAIRRRSWLALSAISSSLDPVSKGPSSADRDSG